MIRKSENLPEFVDALEDRGILSDQRIKKGNPRIDSFRSGFFYARTQINIF